MSGEDSFLNEVNITSRIRAPGEYKYYYCGENSSESDKSFLVVSSMWYSDKITDEMDLITSCYNQTNTAQLFINKKTNIYNILIYQNIIDYRNENMTLKLIKKINIPSKLKLEMITNRNDFEKNNIKIYFVANDYLLLNEIDNRILLLDINDGNFITIFCKISEEKESLYNIIDIYDEPYMTDGEQRIRTYVFLSIKNQERKTPTYSYKYFIVQRNVFKLKTFFLHSIDFDLGNAEPLGLKIAKIKKLDSAEQKFMYIFIFISANSLLQLVTDYDNVTLHQMLKKHSRNNNIRNIVDEMNENMNEDSNNSSNQNNNSSEKIQDNDDLFYKTKHWIVKRNVESEKKQFSQSIKIALNVNNKRLCAFILFFEAKRLISYTFNYTDSPEEIKDKIFVNSNINLRLDDRNFEQSFKKSAKIFKFVDCYCFKAKCFFGYSNNNLIIGDKNKMHIYNESNVFPIYTYEFYNEVLSSFFLFDGLGSTFLLAKSKLFKIIFNTRYDLFSNEKVFKNDKIFIHDYKFEKKMGFPTFEKKPEDIWNSYCAVLGIDPVYASASDEKKFSRKIPFPPPSVTGNDTTTTMTNNNEEEEDYEEEYFNFKNKKNSNSNLKTNKIEKVCALCCKKCEKCCSDCNMRFYCSKDHFRYDYYSYHFFECQLIQFFQRKDIMTIEDKEIRYKVLYNELIKVAGRILTFIFKRIFYKYDYQYFLRMILTLIQIMDNFGFKFNLSEFCVSNFNSSNEKEKHKNERILFYQEALFFYVHLNILKCTFALKSGLYNLTDCYIKIIKNDIIPLLTPKLNRRLISFKCQKPKHELIYNNNYFNEFDSELFFDITKYIKNTGSKIFIDLVEEYIIKHLMTLTLLAKFKKKINSSMEVQNSFVDIYLMFDDHYNESDKNIVAYCFFFSSFYLVEIGKVPQTVILFKRIVTMFSNSEKDKNNKNENLKLKCLIYYNLGLLQYAIGYFDIGIHNMEFAYKLIVDNNFSDKMKFKVIDSLGLAYLNRKNLYKAYLLIQTSIQERKKLDKKNNEIICTKLNVYLNYIIDLYEYTFISKARLLIKKKYKNSDKRQLLKFVLGEDDKELVISEQNIDQFIKVVQFIWDLPDHVLKQLNIDNPPKAPSDTREEHHGDRNLSFNSDVSMTSTFIYRDNYNEKEDFDQEYEEDIEVKTTLYDTLLTRKQKQDFKELKTIYLKRDIILRDSLGEIEKFNINYDPIYAVEFQKIIEKLKSNFLLKEIFYCFQNEKWRDELYNYNQNNILFGLSKYLKLEKIQNMMAIEKTKIMEMIKQEKLKQKNYMNNQDGVDTFKFDYNKNMNNNFIINNGILEETENDIEIPYDNLDSNSSLINDKENENKNLEKETNMDYQKFKEKFITALKEIEKDKRNEDLYEFLNFDEDYLYNLYINVYKNNPDYEFIFQNPLLILNYIFIEINKGTDKEVKKSYLGHTLNISKINEEKNSFQSSFSQKNEEKEKTEKDTDKTKPILSKSSSSNSNESKSISEENSISQTSSSKKSSDNKDKYKSHNSNDNNNDLIRMNTFTTKFLLSQLLYDYSSNEILETQEISLSFICEKKVEESTLLTGKQREPKDLDYFRGYGLSSKDKDFHKTFIYDTNKFLYSSKDISKDEDLRKTYANYRKYNSKKINPHIKTNSENVSGFSFSPNGKPKSKSKSKKKQIKINMDTFEEENKAEVDDNFNSLKKRKINYKPFINKKQNQKNNRKGKKNSNLKNKKDDENYFNLEKELNDKKPVNKKRVHSMDVEENDYKFQKRFNKKKINTNFDDEDNSFKNNSIPKKKYHFKTKDEMEKEIENGAIKYLQMDYKNKNKNKIRNNRVFKSSGVDEGELKKKIYNKSMSQKEKKNLSKNRSLEKNKYLNEAQNRNENTNRNQNMKNKKPKFNSSTTINSSTNDINVRRNKNNDYNDSLSNDYLYPNKKNKEFNLFQKEYKNILKFNKKLKNDSQENNKENKNNKNKRYPFGLTLENNKSNDNDDSDEMLMDSHYKDCKLHKGNSMPKKYLCNFKDCPHEDKKSLVKYNPKKYNAVQSTTNYTNTETPKTTFPGKYKNNNSKRKGYSRELTRMNNK